MFTDNQVAGFNERKHKAVTSMYELYYPAIIIEAIKMTGGAHYAKDCAAKAILSTLDHPAQYEKAKNIKNYILKAVRSECRDEMKKEKNRRINSREVAERIKDLDENDRKNEEIRRIYNEVLYRAIEILPTKSKIVFLLWYVDKMKYREIAERLQVSQNTVENQIEYARKKLKMDHYQRGGDNPFLLMLLFPILSIHLFDK